MDIADLCEEAVSVFAPPPALTTSQWADEYRHVVSGPFPGKWRSNRAPQSIEPMDATSDPSIEGLVIVKPTRSSGTEIINNCIGRRIHLDPCDMLYVQSTDEIADKYSNEVFTKRMIQPTPELRSRISNRIRGRKATETIDRKNYPGGTLHMIGAKSPHKFTMVDYKVVIFDDVAKYDKIKSGDPLELGIGRTKGIWDRLIIMVSNPGEDGSCPLQPYFNLTDQRHRYVPCPRCGTFQVMKFGGADTEYGLKWDDTGDVWYECEHCHGRIEEHEKGELDRRGEWRAHNLDASPRWRGYKLNPFLTTWQPWKTELVDRWLAARKSEKFDPSKVKTFVTERLGDWYKPRERDKISSKDLYDRREDYLAEVPRGVLNITIGVDVQGDRLEAKAIGWGRDYEHWIIEKKVIYGNPVEKDVWDDLDKFLLKTWRHEDGMEIGCSRVFIDSSDGNLTQKVYDYTTTREIRNVFSSKGESQRGKAVLSRWSTVNNKQTKLAFVGTDSAKDLLYSWLALKEPGPGYCHIPLSIEEDDIKQLLGEYKLEGQWVQKQGVRNEDLDIHIYSLAAMWSLTPDWDELEKNIGADSYAYRIFTGYDINKHLDIKTVLTPQQPIIVCVSFDRDNCTWLIAQSDGQTIKIIDDISMRGADTYRMGQMLRKKYEEQIKAGVQFTIYGPEADKSEYAILSELGFRRQVVNKTDIRANMNAISAILEGITTKLVIHPRCVMLRKDLELCAWMETGAGIDQASGRGYAVTSLGHYIGYAHPLRLYKPNNTRLFYK